MASSYSTSLFLELMETGANASTWGTNTNNNLKIVDAYMQRVSTVTVNGDANVASANASGTLSAAANKVLEFQGSLSANATVTIPNVDSNYLISTTGMSLNGNTLKVAPYGNTGASVELNEDARYWIYIENDQAFNGFEKFGDIIVNGNNTISGDLTVNTDTLFVDSTNNRVGIGTTSPQDNLHITSANPEIRLEDSDDSAYSVIAGSGGSLFLQADDDDAAASSIIGFQVDNSEKMRIDSSGQVGIGTDSPDTILHIESDQPTYKLTSTNELQTTSGTEKIVDIDFEGQRNDLYRTTARIKARQDGTWSISTSNLAPTALDFFTQDDSSSDTMGTPRMTINNKGFVGIGTTSPVTELDVNGSETIDGTDNVAARFGVGGNCVQLGSKTGNTPFVAAPSGSSLILQTDNTRRVLIDDSTGDVTIDNDLNVTGNINLDDNSEIRLGDSGDLRILHNNTNSIIQDAGTGDLYLAGDNNVIIANSGLSEFKALFGTNSACILYHNNTPRIATRDDGGAIIGNLNIASSEGSATARLDVTGSDTIGGTDNVAARFGSSGAGSYLHLGSKNGNTPFVAAPSGSDLILQTNNTRRLKVEDSTGDVSIDNDLSVSGALSKGSGSFKINHPLPSKTNTHHLVHSFIEGPQADNNYRGKINLVNGSATINLDTEFGMTEGTFVALNREIQCFTSNETDWDNVKGSINGNILTINCQNTSSTATISWMVIGERKDQHIMDAKWTDSQGKVILEPEIIPDPE